MYGGTFLAPATEGQLSLRLCYREMKILLNGGISFDFVNEWCYSFIYVYF